MGFPSIHMYASCIWFTYDEFIDWSILVVTIACKRRRKSYREQNKVRNTHELVKINYTIKQQIEVYFCNPIIKRSL